MAARRVDQLILHLAVAANTVGIGVVLALLADLQDAYGFPTYGLGLIAGSSFVSAFVGFVFFSKYADLGHAKTMLVWGMVGGVIALVSAAFVTSLWGFVFARALLGLAEGVFVPAARRVVLDWAPKRPGEVLGRILAAGVAGFALGPMVGALLADSFGLRVPFLVPAAVLALAIPVILRLRPSTPHYEGTGKEPMWRLLGSRLLLAGIAFGLVEYAAIGLVDALWARLLTDLGASTLFVGMTFTAMALPMVLLASFFGRMTDRRSPLVVAGAAMIVIVPSMLAYGFASSPVLLAVAATVHSFGSAALAPAAASLVARGSPPEMLARGQGLLEAAGFLGAAAAAFPAGLAYDTIGRAPFMVMMNVLFVLFAVVATLWGRRELRRPSTT